MNKEKIERPTMNMSKKIQQRTKDVQVIVEHIKDILHRKPDIAAAYLLGSAFNLKINNSF